MKKKDIVKNILLIIFAMIITFLINYIFISRMIFKTDKDYQNLNLGLSTYDIKYYVVYDDDPLQKYKVYKMNISWNKEKLRNKLEESDYWNKNKFYEYVMMRFYEYLGDERIELDREDLYYYDNNGIYAIFDLKNEKLYYLQSYLYSEYRNYSDILGIKVGNYSEREIYSVRGGLQYDGLDYYVYEFSKENGEKILEELEHNDKWNKNRLDDNILDDFEYNKEVLSIENGYYHYELVCRTSDKYKKEHFTEKEATGHEIAVYDIEKNILYYYWDSI